MSLSKTAAAAEKAVTKSQSKAAVARTPAQILSDIRRNLAARLAVTPDDVRFLLALYDTTLIEIEKLNDFVKIAVGNDKNKTEEIAKLTAEVADFREVYERENRSGTLQVDVLKEPATEPSTSTRRVAVIGGVGALAAIAMSQVSAGHRLDVSEFGNCGSITEPPPVPEDVLL